MSNTEPKRLDIHQHVTDQIIAAIEAGAGQVEMPWNRANLARPVNIDTGNHYRGVNVLALWVAAECRGYTSSTWGTYRQWQNRGCQVRKGEKASVVVFYKELDVANANPETGETESGSRLIARASWVFNASQVDGYTAPESASTIDLVTRLENADRFIAATGAQVRHGGGRAFFCPSTDHIQMPETRDFTGTATMSATEGYYATLLHELTHWTGAKHRLERDFSGRFGDEAYAIEELVAEIGAAFLCADLGITAQARPDHAAYIDHWLKVMKADKRAIFAAASKAAQATDYLQGLQSSVREAAA